MVVERKKCGHIRSSGILNLIHRRESKKPCIDFWTLSFTLETMKSFIQNINIMVFIHIAISTSAVFIFHKLDVSFEVNAALFVSPIIFPLAFSINSDFQRRERVLEDLAAFKAAGMTWYFCMNEWKKPAGLDANWLRSVRKKVENLLYLLSEYLLTCNVERRLILLRAIYDEFNGANDLMENLRASNLPSNTAIVSRMVQLVHLMCLSFERLRVVRDYRSPRSIRAFSKVAIIMLLITLAPYFVHVGIQSGNIWQPYYLAVILAFIFSTLQGVQDKLDDPFDGIGEEDDINVDTMGEWEPILESINRNNPIIGQAIRNSILETSATIPLQKCRYDGLACVTDDNLHDTEDDTKDLMNTITPDRKSNVYSDFAVYLSTADNLIYDELVRHSLDNQSHEGIARYSSPNDNHDYANNNNNQKKKKNISPQIPR